MISQSLAIAQGYRELYSITGLEGVALYQMRCCHKVNWHQRYDGITMGELTDEATRRSISLCSPDLSWTFDDG